MSNLSLKIPSNPTSIWMSYSEYKAEQEYMKKREQVYIIAHAAWRHNNFSTKLEDHKREAEIIVDNFCS